MLRWKGRIFRSLLFPERIECLPEEARLLDRLRVSQKELSDVLYETPTDDRGRFLRERRLEQLQKRRNELELELSRLREKRDVKNSGGEKEELALREVLARHANNAVVLDFLVHSVYLPSEAGESTVIRKNRWSKDMLSVWVLGSGDEAQGAVRIDLGEASKIEAAMQAYLEELRETRGVARQSPRNKRGPTPVNDRLRELVWEPVEALVGDSSIVIVSPDSFLGMVPFETLQDDDGSYLLESHAFAYLQDTASLPNLVAAHCGNDRHGLLVAGGIDYNGSVRPPRDLVADADTRGGYRRRWSRLRATAQEADSIVEIHEQSKSKDSPRLFLEKKSATEEHIKHEMPNYRYIHLATHGYFQPEGLPSMWKNAQEREDDSGLSMMRDTERVITGLMPGLLSGLVFAGANAEPEEGRDNGLLTAEEVTYLDLSNCDLVVLSACETGLGRPESGEGMIGLRRSFRIAGARTVISSLWSVKDEATSDLMTMFYQNLWLKKMGKLEALRTAQLEMLKRNRAEYGEGLPSTWGAFVLDGDWR